MQISYAANLEWVKVEHWLWLILFMYLFIVIHKLTELTELKTIPSLSLNFAG